MEKEIYLGKFFDQKLILKVDDEVDNEVDWTEEDWRKQWTNYLENGYKWNGDLDIDNNNSYCSDCRELKNGKKHQYKICNVQFTKEEYENKIKELRK